MTENVFNQLSNNENNIILREEALMSEFSPTQPLHRDAELQAIAEAVKPLAEGKQADNLFINGDSGAGKTTCVKHVLKELEKHTGKVKTVYVNCWQNATRMAIYSLIAQALGEALPRRGLATDEVYNRINEVMEKTGTRILLVLDELDSLFFHDEQKLLYELAQSGKSKPFFAVIGISIDSVLLSNADERIKSSLRFSELEFKHYKPAQIADILTERAKASLAPGSYSKEVIAACSAKVAVRKSNVRVGLELLWKAAKHAERAGRKKIALEDVKAVDEKGTDNVNTEQSIDESNFEARSASLTEEERLIVEILKAGEKQSDELYGAFLKKMPRTKRQIRNYLSELKAKKIIETEKVKGSNEMLNTRIIRLSTGGEKK